MLATQRGTYLGMIGIPPTKMDEIEMVISCGFTSISTSAWPCFPGPPGPNSCPQLWKNRHPNFSGQKPCGFYISLRIEGLFQVGLAVSCFAFQLDATCALQTVAIQKLSGPDV